MPVAGSPSAVLAGKTPDVGRPGQNRFRKCRIRKKTAGPDGIQSRSNRAIHIGMVTMQDRVVSTLIAEAYFASLL